MSAISHAASRAAAGPLEALRILATALRRAALITLALVVGAGAYMTWIRDLPLFEVRSVEVVGTDDALIVATLTDISHEMTTLHVRRDRLEEVADHFPILSAVRAEPSFPTGLKLVVEVREPVALARLSEGVVPVAVDGTLLPGVKVEGRVPTIAAKSSEGAVVGESADQVRVIGAAPAPLVPLIKRALTRDGSGIAIELEGGVELRFGTAAAAARKWASAAAVLADDELSSLAYIDVSAPERPSVGGAVGGTEVEIEVEVAPIAEEALPEVAAEPAATEAAAEPAAEIAPEAATESGEVQPAVP